MLYNCLISHLQLKETVIYVPPYTNSKRYLVLEIKELLAHLTLKPLNI